MHTESDKRASTRVDSRSVFVFPIAVQALVIASPAQEADSRRILRATTTQSKVYGTPLISLGGSCALAVVYKITRRLVRLFSSTASACYFTKFNDE